MHKSILVVLTISLIGTNALFNGGSSTQKYHLGPAGAGGRGTGAAGGVGGQATGAQSGKVGTQNALGGKGGDTSLSGMDVGGLSQNTGSNTGPVFNGAFNQVAAGAGGPGAMDIAFARAGGDSKAFQQPAGPMADFRQDTGNKESGNGSNNQRFRTGSANASGGETRSSTATGGAQSTGGKGGNGTGAQGGDSKLGGNNRATGGQGGKLDFSPQLSVPLPVRKRDLLRKRASLRRRALEMDMYDEDDLLEFYIREILDWSE